MVMVVHDDTTTKELTMSSTTKIAPGYYEHKATGNVIVLVDGLWQLHTSEYGSTDSWKQSYGTKAECVEACELEATV